jgi:hypothetical protein
LLFPLNLKGELERKKLETVEHNIATQPSGIAKELVFSGASGTFRNFRTSAYVMEESTFECITPTYLFLILLIRPQIPELFAK